MKKLALGLMLALWASVVVGATLAERYTALLTALNDAAPDVALQNKVADSVVELERQRLIDGSYGQQYDPDALTDNQKRFLVLHVVKRALKSVVLRNDQNVATAASDLETAQATAVSEAESSLPDEAIP